MASAKRALVNLLLLSRKAESAFVVHPQQQLRAVHRRNNLHPSSLFFEKRRRCPRPHRRRRTFDDDDALDDASRKSDGQRVGLFAAPDEKYRRASAHRDRPPRRERTVVIMYHKPPNVITSHSNADRTSSSRSPTSDSSPRRTVYEDIYGMKGFVRDYGGGGPMMLAGDCANDDEHDDGGNDEDFEEVTGIRSKLHAVGRLDADTTGLLLLTNDGALVHRITNPNAKIEDGNGGNSSVRKTYEAVVMGHHSLPPSTRQSSKHDNDNDNNDENPLQTLLDRGVTLSAKHGGQTKPVDALSVLSHPTRSTTRVSVTISEGKNRQVRRMFHAVGSGVMKLHRARVGDLTLRGLASREGDVRIARGEDGDDELDLADNGLKEGEWRLLTEDEIRMGLGWKCRDIDGDVADGRRKKANDPADNGRRRNRKRRRRTISRR